MLHRRAEPADEETGEERAEAARHSGGEEAERGDGGAGGEQPRLAPALGEDAGRDLEARHAAAVARSSAGPTCAKLSPNSTLQMGSST